MIFRESVTSFPLYCLFFTGIYLGMYKSILFLQDILSCSGSCMLSCISDSRVPLTLNALSLPLSLGSRYKRV